MDRLKRKSKFLWLIQIFFVYLEQYGRKTTLFTRICLREI